MFDRVCILGSTGSVGSSALEVISQNRDRYRVTVLTANQNYQKLFQQCETFQPKKAIMACEESALKLRGMIKEKKLNIEVRGGRKAVEQAAAFAEIDIVIAAIVGAAGLVPTMTSVNNSHKILLANKEALVMSGDIFMQAVKEHGAILLPVDSEHNAIFQSLPKSNEKARPDLSGVDKILLTGSGGPFLDADINQLIHKTPQEACAHPNWKMGKKISVDSATMMNKGLELIEACYLFGVTIEQIKIVVHPQSIVHSMVSYIDGSVIAQMGVPDMKTPIAHTLAWPDRINAGVKPLNFQELTGLDFREPDYERFPCLALAIKAIEIGKSAPCVLNAANEIAVAAFLSCRIKFTQIAKIIERTLARSEYQSLTDIGGVVEMDKSARVIAMTVLDEVAES